MLKIIKKIHKNDKISKNARNATIAKNVIKINC